MANVDIQVTVDPNDPTRMNVTMSGGPFPDPGPSRENAIDKLKDIL